MNNNWMPFPTSKPEPGQMCIVAAGPDSVAQIIPLRWCHYDEEFYWMPWPDDPKQRGNPMTDKLKSCPFCRGSGPEKRK